MAENMIKFLRGNVASLPQVATAGAVYFTKDEGLYLGLADGTYHRYGDFIEVADVASLPKAGAHVKAMYYCTAENILAKWDGAKWVQINKQNSLAELGGVDKSVYDAKMAALEKADTDNATSISGIDIRLHTAEEKLKSVATTEGMGELTRAVESHTALIDTINGDVNTAGSMLKIAKDAADAKDDTIQAAQNAADKAQGDVNALSQTHSADKAALEEAIGANTTAVSAAQAKADDAYALAESKVTMDEVNEAIENASQDVTTEVEAAIDEVNNLIGDTEGKTVVEMIADAQTAATYDDEEVRGLIGDNTDAIAQEVEDREGAISDLRDELEGKIDTKVEQSVYDEKVGELVAKDAELAGLINENAAAIGELGTEIDSLVGEDAGKTVRKIANEELAAQLIADNAAEALDSLHEIAAWIQEHPGDAATMNAAIEALQDKVDTDDITVSAYVATAIEALKIGDYATVVALGEAVERIVALEEASANYATKTETQAVADDLSEYETAHAGDYTNEQVDAKVKGVQDQIDALGDTYVTDAELTTAINNEITRANGAYAAKAIESTVDTHVKDGDVHVTTDDKAKWNAAEKNAKDHSDANLETAKAYADQAELDAIAAAKTETESQVAAEAAIARAAEQANATAISNEVTAREQAVSGVQTALDTYKTSNDTAVAGKADKATTLAGYGITDAMTADQINALFTWGSF